MRTGTATIRIGTRRSALATAQANQVATALKRLGHPASLQPSLTAGDRSAAPLAALGGTGVFVTDLRARLLAGEVDVVVHSAKDLPAGDHPELTIAAVPRREDPRDGLVAAGRTLAELRPGATVGTGSPRRAALLRRLRPDVQPVPVRGNIDTRLRRVAGGEVDAVVLACAGLHRLQLTDRVDEAFPVQVMVPAAGQGALAVECRADDTATRTLLGALDDPLSAAALRAERAVLIGLSAGCNTPVGVHARPVPGQDTTLIIDAIVVSRDGDRAVQESVTGAVADPAALGSRLAARLLAAGAAEVIAECR